MIKEVHPDIANETLDQGSELPQDLIHEDLDLIQPLEKSRPNRRVQLVAFSILLIGALSFAGLQVIGANRAETDKSKEKRERVTPVKVAKATTRTVPIQLQAIGTVQTGLSVAVTPQVGGKILSVHFQKGQDVRKGQLLFTLDNQEQLSTIQQAQGTLAKDRALVQQARATLEKDLGAVRQARATLERDQGAVLQARATLEKDKSAVMQAQANLERDQSAVKQARANLAKSEAQAKLAKSQADRYASLVKQGAVTQDQAQQFSTAYQSALAQVQSDRAAIANAEAVVRGDQAAINNAKAVEKGDQIAIAGAESVVKSDQIAIANAEAVVQGDLAAIQNAEGVLEADIAALKTQQVQLSYTKVYAPVDGRAGNILVNVGNVVQANSSTPMVNIVQVHPIQVAFSVPEANLADIQKYADNGKLKVTITFANGDNHPIPGVLSFVNNTVDNTTGTIQLIGDFDNTNGKLWPGQSVNATLTLTQEQDATVVPAQAVQNGPDGQFVFIVKPNQTVDMQPVTVSLTLDGQSVIAKGVQPGDTVVIDGQANLVAGGKIRTGRPGDANKTSAGQDKPGDGAEKTSDLTAPASGNRPDAVTTPGESANSAQPRRRRQRPSADGGGTAGAGGN